MFYRDEPIQIIGITVEGDNEMEVNRAKWELYNICTEFNEKMKRDNRLKEQQKEIIDLKIKNLELERRLLELEESNK